MRAYQRRVVHVAHVRVAQPVEGQLEGERVHQLRVEAKPLDLSGGIMPQESGGLVLHGPPGRRVPGAVMQVRVGAVVGEVAVDEPGDGLPFAVRGEDVAGHAPTVGAFAEVRVRPYAHGDAVAGVRVLSPAYANERIEVERMCVTGVADRAWGLFSPHPPFGCGEGPFGRVDGLLFGFRLSDGLGDFGDDGVGETCFFSDSAYGRVVDAAGAAQHFGRAARP